MGVAHVELSREAERDLRRLSPSDRRRLIAAIELTLRHDPMPANADHRPLVGREPWRRLRVGELRVIYRELTPEELAARTEHGRRIARIVHRGDLHRAIGTLT